MAVVEMINLAVLAFWGWHGGVGMITRPPATVIGKIIRADVRRVDFQATWS
jgi:hypothetical protein